MEIARLEIELIYFEAAVRDFSHYVTETPPIYESDFFFIRSEYLILYNNMQIICRLMDFIAYEHH